MYTACIFLENHQSLEEQDFVPDRVQILDEISYNQPVPPNDTFFPLENDDPPSDSSNNIVQPPIVDTTTSPPSRTEIALAKINNHLKKQSIYRGKVNISPFVSRNCIKH